MTDAERMLIGIGVLCLVALGFWLLALAKIVAHHRMTMPEMPEMPPLPPSPEWKWETVTRKVDVNLRVAAEGRDVVLVVSRSDGEELTRFTVNEKAIEKAGWVRRA